MDEKPLAEKRRFDVSAFGRDTLVYSLGTGLSLIFALILGFITPKYLSTENYGLWQLFILYAAYYGALHLGFVDGLLIRWAGKDLPQFGHEMKLAFIFLILEQIVVIIPISLLVYYLVRPPLQWIWLMTLVYALIMNLANLFVIAAQAARKFKLLMAINTSRALVFLVLVVLLFVLGFLDYHYVIIAYVTSFLLVLFILVYYFRKYLRNVMSSDSSVLQRETILPPIPFWRKGEHAYQRVKISTASLFAYGKDNISVGFFVLLGNFVIVFCFSIDRLIVSSLFPVDKFAIYAFASVIMGMAYTLVTSAADVFFPHIAGVTSHGRNQAYHLGKFALIILWAAILVIYFPIAKVIEIYLPQYTASLPLVKVLVSAACFVSTILILHVNYFKIYRMQRQYFFWGLVILALSTVLIILAIKSLGTLESVAIVMFISFLLWYIINELSLKSAVQEDNREPWRSVAIALCYAGAFWIASLVVDLFIFQIIIYVCLFSAITYFLLRGEANQLATMVSKIISGPR